MILLVIDEFSYGRGGSGGGAENIAWHGWGKETKENHAPHSPLSESTQFHMAHAMILIITFTESFSH